MSSGKTRQCPTYPLYNLASAGSWFDPLRVTTIIPSMSRDDRLTRITLSMSNGDTLRVMVRHAERHYECAEACSVLKMCVSMDGPKSCPSD